MADVIENIVAGLNTGGPKVGVDLVPDNVLATTIAVASNGQILPQGTINVASTANFPATGQIVVATSLGNQAVTYTGTTGTSFTGCTGGLGTMTTGGAVSSGVNLDVVKVMNGGDSINGGFVAPANPFPVAIYPAAAANSGVSVGYVVGGVNNVSQRVRATVYNEQAANAQRSISSANANDAAAGTGARSVKITYYDQTGAGPFTETVALNGVAAVNTVGVNICFIEKMEVLTVGALTWNAGVITLFAAAAGAGGAVCSIGFATVSTGGDMRTLLGHHYTPLGKTSTFATVVCASDGNRSGDYYLTSASPLVAGSADLPISDIVSVAGNGSVSTRSFASACLKVTGFARTNIWATPNGNGTNWAGSFDWSDL